MGMPPRASDRYESSWPAPTTQSEKIQLFGLLAVLGVVAVVTFSSSSQLVTPISLAWRLPVTAIGIGLGAQLGRLLARVNRNYHHRDKDPFAVAFVAFLAGFIFYNMSWSIADSVAFRQGGTTFAGTYRVLACTGKPGRAHWLTINPHGLAHAAMVPIQTAQYDQIRAQFPADNPRCAHSNLCVEVPSERAPDGAIRILVSDESRATAFRLVRPCVARSG
jgi:hypothetical protein